MDEEDVEGQFRRALEGLVEQVKEDRSILAAILGGSLSHDTVWAGSDIDLVLVTIDDRKIERTARALYADGLNVHAHLLSRADFRKAVEGTLRNSFLHAFLAKGRLLYAHDQTIAELCAGLEAIGQRDTDRQLLAAATEALGPVYKAHKWLRTRGDLEYTALYILYAATSLARVEVIGARRIADREVILEALKLNPAVFKTIYSDLLNTAKTPEAVEAALAVVDRYLAERAERLFAPVLDHLREVGEARSATDLDDHFARHFGLEGITAACEYLADQGLLGKAAAPVQLTRRSNTLVQELAFFHLASERSPDGG